LTVDYAISLPPQKKLEFKTVSEFKISSSNEPKKYLSAIAKKETHSGWIASREVAPAPKVKFFIMTGALQHIFYNSDSSVKLMTCV
jgi:hypothetical protein